MAASGPDLKPTLSEYILASVPGIWIQTHEHEDAFEALAQLCRERTKKDWLLFRWDVSHKLDAADLGQRTRSGERAWWAELPCIRALEIQPSESTGESETRYVAEPQQLLTVLPSLATQAKAALPGATTLIMVLDNFGNFLSTNMGKIYSQQIHHVIHEGKAGLEVAGQRDTGPIRIILVVMSPTVVLPSELERLFTVVEHKLPDSDQIWSIVTSLVEPEEIPSDEQKFQVLEAAAGLTRMECENAVALSLVRTFDAEKKCSRVDPQVIWELKSQFLKRSGLLTLYQGDASFDRLGGVEYFKDFGVRLLKSHKGHINPLLVPRGLLLLGVPGSGKSESVRCLANATGRKLLQMDIGSLMSKYVGDSDRNMREALAIADAMAPCILHVEEVEKALSGVGSSGDSGVSTRIFGQWLSWLNDHTTDVFVVCTSNDISALPPEFSRAERFDGIFFFDLPTDEERLAIWTIYLERFGHKVKSELLDRLISLSDGWTGAEIRSCARLAALLDESLEAQAKTIVPVSKSADAQLAKLRQWASGRCLSVRSQGVYRLRDRNSGTAAAPRILKKKKRRQLDSRN